MPRKGLRGDWWAAPDGPPLEESGFIAVVPRFCIFGSNSVQQNIGLFKGTMRASIEAGQRRCQGERALPACFWPDCYNRPTPNTDRESLARRSWSRRRLPRDVIA
ncbi:hypothetical protein GCM10009078_28920 [Cupriavidus gilardii]